MRSVLPVGLSGIRTHLKSEKVDNNRESVWWGLALKVSRY